MAPPRSASPAAARAEPPAGPRGRRPGQRPEAESKGVRRRRTHRPKAPPTQENPIFPSASTLPRSVESWVPGLVCSSHTSPREQNLSWKVGPFPHTAANDSPRPRGTHGPGLPVSSGQRAQENAEELTSSCIEDFTSGFSGPGELGSQRLDPILGICRGRGD